MNESKPCSLNIKEYLDSRACILYNHNLNDKLMMGELKEYMNESEDMNRYIKLLVAEGVLKKTTQNRYKIILNE